MHKNPMSAGRVTLAAVLASNLFAGPAAAAGSPIGVWLA